MEKGAKKWVFVEIERTQVSMVLGDSVTMVASNHRALCACLVTFFQLFYIFGLFLLAFLDNFWHSFLVVNLIESYAKKGAQFRSV